MRDVVLYVGGFRLPDGNASALRALANAKLFASLGYHPVLVGKCDAARPTDGAPMTRFEVQGIDCYDIRHPDQDRAYPSYTRRADAVQRVVEQYGVERIYAIIAYNYPAEGLWRLLRFARRRGLVMVADSTEWYGSEAAHMLASAHRLLHTQWRMRRLHRQVGNVICGSRFLQHYYARHHTVLLPTCVDLAEPKWQIPIGPSASGRRRFIYAGSPGLGLSKEYVHWLVDAFAQAKRQGHDFLFTIVGLSEPQLLQVFPQYADALNSLGDSVAFLGRLPHLRTIAEMRQSDFLVFVRPQNRVSQAGCPTKLSEAFSCGIPTIVNDTGDIGLYLRDGEHGFLLSHPDCGQFSAAIGRALAVSEEELRRMKEACRRDNPFRYELYREKVREFLLSVR